MSGGMFGDRFKIAPRRLRQGSGTSLFLREDGTFAAPPGGSGSPGGSDTQIQYNNGGAFGGVSGLTYNDVTGFISIVTDVNLTAPFNILAGADWRFYEGTNSFYAKFDPIDLTGDRTFTFPDASGTLALTSTKLNEFAAPDGSVNFNDQQATSFRIENRTSDPGTPTVGQIWLRTDL